MPPWPGPPCVIVDASEAGPGFPHITARALRSDIWSALLVATAITL